MQTDIMPADRIAGIGVSEILKIGARATAMRRAGEDVIVLGTGEPDFDTPDHIKEAAEKARNQFRRTRFMEPKGPKNWRIP